MASETSRNAGGTQKTSRLARLATLLMAGPLMLRHRLIAGWVGYRLGRVESAKDPGDGKGGRIGGGGNDSGTAVITRTRTQTKKPNLYRVLLLNDDYTPMEFVIVVLQRYFNKTADEATHIMLHVHRNGVGECGVFTYEVAETKVTQVMDFARKHQHPLQCVMEKK